MLLVYISVYEIRKIIDDIEIENAEVFNLKISTKGRYGLTIMIELAKKHGEGPTSLKSIAQNNDLSEHYLEQILYHHFAMHVL